MFTCLNSIAKCFFVIFLFLNAAFPCSAELRTAEAAAADMFIFYSASSGENATDGPPESHSPFVEAFLNNLYKDEPINLIAIDIVADTYKLTGGGQIPEFDSKIMTNKMYSLANRDSTKRYALLIGNSGYPGISRLGSPVNEIQEIAGALRLLGYEVDLTFDANMVDMERDIVSFVAKLAAEVESEGFFWYAGHGVEIDREIFLLPVDCNYNSDSLLRASAVSLSLLTEKLALIKNKINVVFVDTSRSSPFDWQVK